MPNRFFLAPLLLAAGLALAGCSSAPPLRPDLQTAPAAAPLPAPGPSNRERLDTERARLAELFKGTPVVFVTTSEGNLRATVPRRYCFDPGASVVKPPLAAVLGRIAKSQLATDSRFRIAVPTEAGARPALATDRAASVRDWMAGQGIAPARMQVTGSTQTEVLELFVLPQPAV